MKSFAKILVVVTLLLGLPCINSKTYAKEVEQGDKATIITPGTVARLCPFPNCGQDEHITRIPKGTSLDVEGIQSVKTRKMPPVKWFEVTYTGKKGWISIYDTDVQ